MPRRAALRAATAVALTLVVGACRSSDAASPEVASTVGGVGALPGSLPPASTVMEADASEAAGPAEVEAGPAGSAPAAPAGVNDGTTTVGRLVEGNRVLAIGDSIMASISDRYGGQLCQQLVPRGWEVAVDAEVGGFVEFGREVLQRRPPEEWDAAIVMLGNNYDGDPQAFAAELGALLDALEPLPVVLLNVTRFEPQQDDVNWILAVEDGRRDDVVLLDWTARTAEGAPGADELLSGDGLHLSPGGQQLLALMIGRVMGRAPSGSQGACLPATTGEDGDQLGPDGTAGEDDEPRREPDVTAPQTGAEP